jgi:hypothetical protein
LYHANHAKLIADIRIIVLPNMWLKLGDNTGCSALHIPECHAVDICLVAQKSH